MEAVNQSKWLLNPMDRAAEILFGLIMALTFTCSISIANTDQTELRQLLVAAIGCNLAWGVVDACMYLIGVLAQRSRSKMMFQTVQNSQDASKAQQFISDALPPIIASAIGEHELEQIRNKLSRLKDTTGKVRLTLSDLKKAIALFSLIFISTFPLVVPFVFIPDTTLALRVSNAVAIVMMFLCGWSVARYVGFSKWKMSVAMVLIGMLLVVVTIALGG